MILELGTYAEYSASAGGAGGDFGGEFSAGGAGGDFGGEFSAGGAGGFEASAEFSAGGAGGYGFEGTTTTTTTTTTSTGGFGVEGAEAGEGGYGVEGGDNEGTVGYGTSVIQGLPSVPSNQLESTMGADVLPA